MDKKIRDNLAIINDNIAKACDKSGRSIDDVTLIAVTKSVEVDSIRALLELGHVHMGESRSPEIVKRNAVINESISRRIELPGINPNNRPIRPVWHMIGHLQRNKVKSLLPIVEYIHSVDSLRLAEEINTTAAKLGLEEKVKILLQVNTSQEKQKYGLAVGAVAALAEQIITLPNLQVSGLMTMAPNTLDSDRCRFCFSRLREIFEDMKTDRIVGPEFKHLSMGMSQDYVEAIEEGGTMVRIGSALFA
ncbi:MAG: YggS family pyridoxal phosphate-dependent enzyme [Phycisphaerae bacterium]|nr:YggS family pyridoxal phosphate-dependent enzyme [Phycisphaerae bacterium]